MTIMVQSIYFDCCLESSSTSLLGLKGTGHCTAHTASLGLHVVPGSDASCSDETTQNMLQADTQAQPLAY